MKKVIWIVGIITWIFFLLLFHDLDAINKNHTHEIILIITGICLAIYIYRKTGSNAKELEKENQALKSEIEKLRLELQEQAVRQAINKSEKKKGEKEK